MTQPAAPAEPRANVESSTAIPFHYTQSDSFAAILQELDATLLVSTYQANKLLVLRAHTLGSPARGATSPGLSILVRTFDKPMGLAVDKRRLALATRSQVWLFRNPSAI